MYLQIFNNNAINIFGSIITPFNKLLTILKIRQNNIYNRRNNYQTTPILVFNLVSNDFTFKIQK